MTRKFFKIPTNKFFCQREDQGTRRRENLNLTGTRQNGGKKKNILTGHLINITVYIFVMHISSFFTISFSFSIYSSGWTTNAQTLEIKFDKYHSKMADDLTNSTAKCDRTIKKKHSYWNPSKRHSLRRRNVYKKLLQQLFPVFRTWSLTFSLIRTKPSAYSSGWTTNAQTREIESDKHHSKMADNYRNKCDQSWIQRKTFLRDSHSLTSQSTSS